MRKLLFVGIAFLVFAGNLMAACPQCVIGSVAKKPGCKCGEDCTCKPGKRADNCKCGPSCPCARSKPTTQPGAFNGLTINGQPMTVKRGLFGRLRAVPDYTPRVQVSPPPPMMRPMRGGGC